MGAEKVENQIRDSNREYICNLLTQHEGDISYINKKSGPNKNTLLHRAAFNGDDHVSKLLLNAGADVNAKNAYGNTPLHVMAYYGIKNVKMLKVLLDAKADVSMKNFKGNTALHLVPHGDNDEYLAAILLSSGANVNEKNDEGLTALHYAVKYNRYSICEYLLSQDADVNVKDMDGRTPLHYAAFYNKNDSHHDIAKLLLANGANIHAVSESNGETPFQELQLIRDEDIDTKIVRLFSMYLMKKVDAEDIQENKVILKKRVDKKKGSTTQRQKTKGIKKAGKRKEEKTLQQKFEEMQQSTRIKDQTLQLKLLEIQRASDKKDDHLMLEERFKEIEDEMKSLKVKINFQTIIFLLFILLYLVYAGKI